mgnify:CR=1 FL=1|jgi:hypothetical protein
MNIDYLLVGCWRNGDVVRTSPDAGFVLPKSLVFNPAHDDAPQYSERTLKVHVMNHLGKSYAVALGEGSHRMVSQDDIGKLIERSKVHPLPEAVNS